ncbi:MAG: electron transfer flavoprotein subunit beta/FixA family protein [Lachnospiraceae bacterium]|nr:electron transfer flavoprotein subunit beta/FixA family protein [Lachnospiraceae bacterium]
MKILVCVKQVPNTNEVKINPKTGTLIRDGVESILNPDDDNALEAALQIKDQNEGTTVTVISMGPPQASDVLIECMAKGADDAILLSSRAFGGADTWATSNTIAGAIRKIKDYDIIFAGRQAIDGDTAQVGPQIAERLGIPQVTYVEEVIKCEEKKLTVKRQLEDGYEIIEIPTPCLLTAVKELNTPRYMSVGGIYEAYEKEITVWSEKDIPVEADAIGINASPTKVFRSFTPEPKGRGMMVEGTPKEAAVKVVEELKKKHFL